MPEYRYKCAKGHLSDINLKMSEYKETIACPQEGCKEEASRDFRNQNILGIVEGGTRGGRFKLRESYHGKKINLNKMGE
jgi:hypothetical protein